MDDDEALVRRACAGEASALAGLFDRYHTRLYRYALARPGDRSPGSSPSPGTTSPSTAAPGGPAAFSRAPICPTDRHRTIPLLRRSCAWTWQGSRQRSTG